MATRDVMRLAAGLLTAAVIATCAPVASAGVANAGLKGASRTNPIAGMPWGPYEGTHEGLWNAYAAAHGRRKALLGRLALMPRALFFGSWFTQPEQAAREIVQDTERGNPNVLTQFETFELHPWEGAWTGSGSWDVAAEKRWYRLMAAGIGDARALVIVQVDLPFAAKTSSQAPEEIDSYGAKVLAARPHTTVYIDAGAAGWLPPSQMGALLIRNGIRSARGFSVNDTQYGSTDLELQYGNQILAYLQSQGIKNKHFLVNTAQNGQPYLAGQVSGNSNDTPRCASRHQTLCQRTGIPPTTEVASPRWHLSAADAEIARADVDGYVWASQPWDVNGGPFNLAFALKLAANGAYR